MTGIEEIISKRNEIFEAMMDQFSFMAVYNQDLIRDEDEEKLTDMLKELDDTIYLFQNGMFKDSAASDEALKKMKSLEEAMEKII